MKLPARARKWGLRFNVTPLIDVVFLLIIFFLVSSHFVRYELLEEVELPRASQTEKPQHDAPSRLVVTVTADERLHVGARQASLARIEQLIVAGGADAGDTFQVRIRTDRSVPYRVVEPIMLACARSGVRDLQFAVIQEQR